MRRMISLLLILTLSGCGGPRRDRGGESPRNVTGRTPASLGESEEETVVLLLVDMSGSFAERMANGGAAYKFSLAILDRYFRAGLNQDKLVIAQISGSDKSLLFEGTPLDLRRQYPTPDSFREMLVKHADTSGSHVHKSINNSMKYVLSDQRVLNNNRARVAVFVLSDMIDSSGTREQDDEERQMNHQIVVLGLRGGVMGVYFADQEQAVRWRHKLSSFGLKHFVVMGEVSGNPTMPSFDE